jgi:hypothetical protein
MWSTTTVPPIARHDRWMMSPTVGHATRVTGGTTALPPRVRFAWLSDHERCVDTFAGAFVDHDARAATPAHKSSPMQASQYGRWRGRRGRGSSAWIRSSFGSCTCPDVDVRPPDCPPHVARRGRPAGRNRHPRFTGRRTRWTS